MTDDFPCCKPEPFSAPDYARLAVLQAERTWVASEMERLDISRTSEHEHANRLHALNKAIKEGIGNV